MALTLAFFALVALYVRSYPSMSLRYEPLLYQGSFAIRLSLYTYASVMLTYFIRKYKDKRGRAEAAKET